MILDKVSLGVVAAACGEKEYRPELAAVHINRSRSAASNGHFALLAKHPLTNDDAVPRIEGVSEETAPNFQEISIPGSAAREILKSVSAPAARRRAWAALVRLDEPSAQKGAVKVGYTDLEMPRVWTSRAADGPFPAIEKVMPTGKPKMRIALNGKYLETIVKAFALAGNDEDGIIIEIWSETTAMMIRPVDEKAAARIEGLLMPLRIPEAMELENKELDTVEGEASVETAEPEDNLDEGCQESDAAAEAEVTLHAVAYADVVKYKSAAAREHVSMGVTQNTHWFEARRAGAVVGIAGLMVLKSGAVRIKGVYVPERLRGEGVATRMTELLEEHAVTELHAETIEVYAYNRAFYEGRGYEAAGTRPNGAVLLRRKAVRMVTA